MNYTYCSRLSTFSSFLFILKILEAKLGFSRRVHIDYVIPHRKICREVLQLWLFWSLASNPGMPRSYVTIQAHVYQLCGVPNKFCRHSKFNIVNLVWNITTSGWIFCLFTDSINLTRENLKWFSIFTPSLQIFSPQPNHYLISWNHATLTIS